VHHPQRRLEQEFQRQWDHPWPHVLLDLTEVGRSDISFRKPEIGVVQEIEKFGAELQLIMFGEANILKRRKIRNSGFPSGRPVAGKPCDVRRAAVQ
jgi:hypothetical protein